MSKSVKHKTLSAYYDTLVTLETYLSPLGSCSRNNQTDSAEYQGLLEQTVCASRSQDDSPSLPKRGECFGSQQEIIDRALRDIARRDARTICGRNILLNRDRSGVELPINPSRPELENRHATSPDSVFRSKPWMILRSRIGDAAFQHVLVCVSLFSPVGNSCYMQLSGTPIFDLPERSKASEQSVLKKRKRRDEQTLRFRKKKKRDTKEEEVRCRPSNNASSPADIIIARQKMFYGQPIRLGDGRLAHALPPKHTLNDLLCQKIASVSDNAALGLLRHIFPDYCGRHGDRRSQKLVKSIASRGRIPGILGTMRELLVRHGATGYAQVLKICLARAHDLTNEGLQPVSHCQVYRFVAVILRRVISTSIAGSVANLQTLLRHARRFVSAKQFEPINLASLLSNLKIDDFRWLCLDQDGRVTQSENQQRRRLVEAFVLWLFNGFLVPLLKSSFFITETAQTRYETVYYGHDEWARHTQPHLRQLQKDLLEPLDPNETYFALRGPLGVSAVRLIPKPNGFRPIVNLGKRIIPCARSGIPTVGSTKNITPNQVLRGVHQVLTFERNRQRDALGSSLFGTNEIFAPIAQLKAELRKQHGEVPRLYFVKMDIKAAFDTIKQDKLLDVLSLMLDKHHDYCMVLYCLLLPPASKASQGIPRRLFKTRAVVDGGSSTSFVDVAASIAQPLRNGVMVDLSRRKQVLRHACLDLLRQHLKHNVWQVGGKYFRQREGIPQGSKISSLLCSFFYAALEREHLRFLHQPGTRLLRYIDDFLLITDNYRLAKRFVTTMNLGFPEYGAFVSTKKTLLSFEYATGSQVAPVCEVDALGGLFFPYCGFLIDTKTLEMSMDYPRTLAGPMEQSFAMRFCRRKGAAFVGWMSRQLENRNQTAYLDTQHNDTATVLLNVFLNFALTGMKIPHYFDPHESITPHQAKIIYDAVCAAAEYTFIAGKARVEHATREQAGEHYSVKRGDFEYLAKYAVLKVLMRKASRFKDVIHLLKKELARRIYRDLEQRHSATIKRGWEAVKGARY